jgi:hypothetical protein
MNPILLELQEDAWNLKDLCDEMSHRTLSKPDELVLESVRRDIARSALKVIAIRDKHKRTRAAGEADERGDELPGLQPDNARTDGPQPEGTTAP